MNIARNKRNTLVCAAAVVSAGLVGSPIYAAATNSAVAFGEGYYGTLGDGTYHTSSPYGVTSPVAVTGLASGVTAVGVGANHGLAVVNGAVMAWGYNSSGQLGNGSTTNTDVPVAVTGLTSGATAVAGGYTHSLAIVNGAVMAWGGNNFGQLGNNSTTNSTVAVAVTGLTSGATAIAAGYYDSYAIVNGGAVAWGYDNKGQLGNGVTTTATPFGYSTPVAVTGLTSNVTAIAAGDTHGLAIQNGALYSWGNNNDGQLGNGTTTNSNTAAVVPLLASGVTAIAAGTYDSLAIANGNVYAWGYNNDGQLGNGTTTSLSVPTLVAGLPSNLTAVAADTYASYALASDGSLWVWGNNAEGQLGIGSTTNQTTPVQLLAPTGYEYTSLAGESFNGYTVVATLTAVPEPASLSLIAVGALTLVRRRRSGR